MTKDLTDFQGRRLWLTAATVAVIASGLGLFYSKPFPGLVVASIIIGSVLVTALEFFWQRKVPHFDVDYDRVLPQKHDFFIAPQRVLSQKVGLATTAAKNFILMGPRGSGKTTFAQQFCREIQKEVDDSKAIKRPVFMSFSHSPPRSNGMATLCLEMIAQNLVCDKSPERQESLAKKLIKQGSLCLIFDDLDYLSEQDLFDLAKLIKRRSTNRNSFLCILSEETNSRYFEGFESIPMPAWESGDVIKYIHGRIKDNSQSVELINHLKEWNQLERSRTPFQWNYIVDLALNGRIYELFYAHEGLGNNTDYEILDQYLKIVIKSGSEYDASIKELGKLSLKLLKQGRTDFTLDQIKAEDTHIHILAPKLFNQYENVFVMHSTLQLFLAAKYLVDFWPEAKTDLTDDSARTLIWTATYRCIRQLMIAPGQVKELDDIFHSLYQIELKDTVETKGG